MLFLKVNFYPINKIKLMKQTADPNIVELNNLYSSYILVKT